MEAMASPLGRGRLQAQRQGADLMQPATVTWHDRHPALFGFVAALLARHVRPRLLSFGCSTGEEAFTLARRLPNAMIDAIDANPACVAQAKRGAAAREATRIRFVCADRPDPNAGARYDAVFCLSVLRHSDLDNGPRSCAAVMSFARFEAAVVALDACLRPGGLLVLWGCHFRFTDVLIAAGYRPLPTPGLQPQPGPFYGRDNERLDDDSYAEFVFLKQR